MKRQASSGTSSFPRTSRLLRSRATRLDLARCYEKHIQPALSRWAGNMFIHTATAFVGHRSKCTTHGRLSSLLSCVSVENGASRCGLIRSGPRRILFWPGQSGRQIRKTVWRVVAPHLNRPACLILAGAEGLSAAGDWREQARLMPPGACPLMVKNCTLATSALARRSRGTGEDRSAQGFRSPLFPSLLGFPPRPVTCRIRRTHTPLSPFLALGGVGDTVVVVALDRPLGLGVGHPKHPLYVP